MGVSAVQMESTQRRDRLLYHRASLRRPCFTFWGPWRSAERATGKANTVNPAFTLCIARGQTYLQLLPTMPEIQSEKLLRRFLNYCFSTPKPQTSPHCSQCPVEKI